MTYAFDRAEFLTGARVVKQFPPDDGREVAFAGRSNAGKSSVLNTLTRRRALARTSKQPGRTQEINFFVVTPNVRLVDLPGYGYAKVPAAVQRQWRETLEQYLSSRRSLAGLVLVMDVRRPFTDLDLTLVGWALQSRLPLHLLLTKADKLGRGHQSQTLRAAQARCADLEGEVSVQLFSAPKFQGVDDLRDKVSHWLAD